MVERAASSRQPDTVDDAVSPGDEKRFVAAVRHLLRSPPAPKPAKKVGSAGTSRRPRARAKGREG
jgi:hypothetical protein